MEQAELLKRIDELEREIALLPGAITGWQYDCQKNQR